MQPEPLCSRGSRSNAGMVETLNLCFSLRGKESKVTKDQKSRWRGKKGQILPVGPALCTCPLLTQSQREPFHTYRHYGITLLCIGKNMGICEQVPDPNSAYGQLQCQSPVLYCVCVCARMCVHVCVSVCMCVCSVYRHMYGHVNVRCQSLLPFFRHSHFFFSLRRMS